MTRRPTLTVTAQLAAVAACVAAACTAPSVAPATRTGFGHTTGLDAPAPAAAEPTPLPARPAAAATAAASADGSAGGSPAAAAPGAAPGDPIASEERSLRERFAQQPGVETALALAALLCETERHADALALLEAGRPWQDVPQVRVARAGVLRDLGRRHLAVAELRALHAELGAAALHPGLLFERAELEWLEGQRDAARAALAELRALYRDHAWVVENRTRLDALQLDVDTRTAPQRVAWRDALGSLRGAPAPATRIAYLERLAADDGEGDGDAVRAELRERAIAIACADPVPAVRIRAVGLARPEPQLVRSFLAAALADEHAGVRACAVLRAAVLLPDGAEAVLLEHLARETAGSVLAAVDRELAHLTRSLPVLAGGAADPTPEQRAALLATWSERCRR